jgi:hypothetical protein
MRPVILTLLLLLSTPAIPSAVSVPTATYELTVEARFVNTIQERIRLQLAYEEAAAKARLESLSKEETQRKTELEQISKHRVAAETVVKQKLVSEDILTKLLRNSDPSDTAARAVLVSRVEVVTRQRASAEEQLQALKNSEQSARTRLNQVHAERESEEQRASVEADRRKELNLTLQSEVVKWQADPSPTNLMSLKRTTLAIAEATGLSSKVNFTSEDAQEKETTGADVKYQTSPQRQFGANPKTAKCTTSPQCFDTISPTNEYYIWTERGGKKTSDSDKKFPIGNADEKVTLVEDR